MGAHCPISSLPDTHAGAAAAAPGAWPPQVVPLAPLLAGLLLLALTCAGPLSSPVLLLRVRRAAWARGAGCGVVGAWPPQV